MCSKDLLVLLHCRMYTEYSKCIEQCMSLSDVCPQSHIALINFPIDTSMHSTQLVGLENTLQSSTLVYLNSK